jgi:hydrogenase maturation protease
VGNLLLGDEGLGIHALRALAGRELPPHVDLLDGGTPGLGLLHLIQGYEKVLIIDAVNAGQIPGAVLRFEVEDVSSVSAGPALSLHDTQVLEVLQWATYVGRALPPIVLFGIQPQTLDWGTELSDTVLGSLDALLEAIQKEVSG